MDVDLIIVGVFLLATLVIGLWKGANNKTIEDYAVGNRNFSNAALVATIFATFAGAAVTTGTIEKIHSSSIYFILIPAGYILQKLFIAYFVPKRVSLVKGAISIGDFLEKIYMKPGKTVSGIITLFSAFAITASQVAALGGIFGAFLGISYEIGAIIGTSILIIYSAFGGIRAVTYTDVFQFGILIFTIPLLCKIGLDYFDGYSHLIAAVPEMNLTFPNSDVFFTSILPLLILFTVSIEPPILQRFLIAKNISQLVKTFSISALLEIPFLITIAIIGLLCVALYPDIPSNKALPHMVNTLLPIGVKGFVFAGFIAVIMSTADSYLNASAVSFVRDLIKPNFKVSDNMIMHLAKLITILIGGGSLIISLSSHSVLDILLKFGGVYTVTMMVPIFMIFLGYHTTPKFFVINTILSLVIRYTWDLLFVDIFHISGILIGILSNVVLFFIFYAIDGKKIDDESGGSKNRSFVKTIKLKITSIKKHISVSLTLEINKNLYVVLAIFILTNYLIPTGQNSHTHNIFFITCNFISVAMLIPLMFIYTKQLKQNVFTNLYWNIVITFILCFVPILQFFLDNFSGNSILILCANILTLIMLSQGVFKTLNLIIGAFMVLLYSNMSPNINSNFGIDLNSGIIITITITSLIAIAITLYGESYLASLNKDLKLKLKETKSEISFAHETKERFLRNIRHEIATPKQWLDNADTIDMIVDESLPITIRKNAADGLKQSVTRISKLTDNLLALAERNNAALSYNFKKHNIVKLLQAITAKHDKLNSQVKISLTVEPGVKQYSYLDKAHLTTAIEHIIDNAVKYGQGSDIKISLSKAGSDQFSIIITDRGVGIPAKELSAIFQPFTESSRTRDFSGGRGLSLAVVQQIVTSHGGLVTASSSDKEGTSLHLQMPYKQKPLAVKSNTTAVATKSSKAANLEKTILVIDDDAFLLDMLSLALSAKGYKVIKALGGKAGIKAMRQAKQIDAIMLDLLMPDKMGTSILEEMQLDSKLKDIPVLLQTGLDDKRHINYALKLGARDVLMKPYNNQQVLSKIEKVLR